MSDLPARLDEDEAIAEAALAGPWHVNRAPAQQGPGLQIVDEAGLVVTWTPGFYKRGDSDAAHIARHDPARVLREVGAKRAIIALCETETDETGGRPLALRILRCFADVYTDDPDLKENRQ